MQVFGYCDRAPFVMASNIPTKYFVRLVKKLRRDGGELSVVNAPLVSVLYNKYMGGVDLADTFRTQLSLTNAFQGETRAYLRVWEGLMEQVIVNTYIIWVNLEARRLLRHGPTRRQATGASSRSVQEQV